MDFLQQVLNASSLAAVVVLVALGLAIIFGLMGVINMAHGELFMVGAYTTYMLATAGLSPWLGLILSPLAGGLLGLIMERGLIRFVYKRPLDSLLATWGVAIVIREIFKGIFGPQPLPVPNPLPGAFRLGALLLPKWSAVVICICVLSLVVTYFILMNSTFGLKVRAALDNPSLAVAMGLKIDRLYSTAFVYGAALAGLAGGAVAPLAAVFPQLGLDYLVQSFLAVIVGGIGTIEGVVTGGAFIGGLTGVLAFFMSPVMAEIAVLFLAALALRLRPQGLLSRGR